MGGGVLLRDEVNVCSLTRTPGELPKRKTL